MSNFVGEHPLDTSDNSEDTPPLIPPFHIIYQP